MQTTQGGMLHSLRAVHMFLDENTDKLATVVNSGARQRLADAITELSAHASEQSGNHLAAKGATQKQRALRIVLLRDHMAPIASIAAADLPPVPEIEPLRMPRGKPSGERLAVLAQGMAKAAVPYAPTFVSAGLPPTFIADLTAAAGALLSSLDDRTQSRGRRSGATKGLRQRLSAGRKIVRVLDTFVKSALKDDPSLLANWRAVKRVPRVTGRAALPDAAAAMPQASTPSA